MLDSKILYSYAFALEECFERGSAERVAKKALAINKKTPLATHTLGEFNCLLTIIIMKSVYFFSLHGHINLVKNFVLKNLMSETMAYGVCL